MLKMKEAVFLASLPHRQSFFSYGGWKMTKGIDSDDWQEFIKTFFLPKDLRKAWQEAKSYPNKLTLNLYGRLAEIKIISIWDKKYPQALANIFDPPPVLFLWGDEYLSYKDYLAIVGTRRASPICQAAIRALLNQIKDLIHKSKLHSTKELAVVSGFALGVDSIAHRVAIELGIGGIGVLGSGLLYASPRTNLFIIKEAVKKNVPFALLSEFPPKMRPCPYNFPRRNRIISGMSSVVHLIQTPLKSGALITARYAIEEGRDLKVFDHDVFDASPGSNEGGRWLIENGAEKIILAELEKQILQKPNESYRPNKEQLSFWKTQQRGLKALGNNFYLKPLN